jgi:hypothetical protein
MSITIDLSGLDKKIAEKAVAMKKSLGTALKEEGGLLALSLVKYTQPFGTNAKAKGQGESAIKKDLTEVFYVLPDGLLAGATTERENMRLFVSRDGIVWLTPMSNWMVGADIETLQARHNSLRDRNGRITRTRNKVDQQGRIATVNLWVITATQFAALLKLAINEVGFAKAGWATVCRKLGRSNSDIPAWIKRHDAPATVIDDTAKEQPSITMVNEVDYTGRVLSESAKRLAIKEREQKIQGAIDLAVKHAVKDK